MTAEVASEGSVAESLVVEVLALTWLPTAVSGCVNTNRWISPNRGAWPALIRGTIPYSNPGFFPSLNLGIALSCAAQLQDLDGNQTASFGPISVPAF
jgi:hypothetical protein